MLLHHEFGATRYRFLFGLVLTSLVIHASLLFFFSTSVLAQDALSPSDDSAVEAEESAIRHSAAEFMKAFKQQDAQAIAQLWTADGIYIDEAGKSYEGRKAIQIEYEDFFKEHQAAVLLVAIESIRVVNPTVAIEYGSAVLIPQPAGARVGSRYVAVHAKQSDGSWLLDSVRDSLIGASATRDNLQLLDLLVGDWTAEHVGIQADVSCSWSLNNSCLERQFNVTRDGKEVSSSTEIIGLDPVTNRVTSWTFSSDGGRSIGTWKALEDGWVVKNSGIKADGTTTSSIDYWAPLLDDALGWRSVRRTAGGEALSDSEHVVLKKNVPSDPSAD